MKKYCKTVCFLQEIQFHYTQYREVEGIIIENIYYANINQRKTSMSIFILDKVNVRE